MSDKVCSGKVKTLKDLKSTYPDKWVLLENHIYDKKGKPVSGTVLEVGDYDTLIERIVAHILKFDRSEVCFINTTPKLFEPYVICSSCY